MKRTAKYTAALACAAEFRVSKARTHVGLYGALQRAGWEWDHIGGEWTHRRGRDKAGWDGPRYRAPTREEAKAHRAAKPTPDLFAGMPLAREAFDAAALEARVLTLESEVRMLHRQLAVQRRVLGLLQEIPAVRERLEGTFGIDIIATEAS